MSDPFAMIPTTATEPRHGPHGAGVTTDEERPPSCPSCNRRLVILATHWAHNATGKPVRRQLWGCPRGHATAYRQAGVFSPVELLPEIAG